MMKAKPWLEKEDPFWSQTVTWNYARDSMVDRWRNVKTVHHFAAQCPLIEEAVWFNRTVPQNPNLRGADIAESILAFGINARSLTYAGMASGNIQYIREAANIGNAMAQYIMSLNARSNAERAHWLDKSLASGYSLAFTRRAERSNVNSPDEVTYLKQGIEHGCISSMREYSLLVSTPSPTKFILVWSMLA